MAVAWEHDLAVFYVRVVREGYEDEADGFFFGAAAGPGDSSYAKAEVRFGAMAYSFSQRFGDRSADTGRQGKAYPRRAKLSASESCSHMKVISPPAPARSCDARWRQMARGDRLLSMRIREKSFTA